MINWKTQIIEERREDGSIYYRCYATMIRANKWFPFLKTSKKYALLKIGFKEMYCLSASYFSSHAFKDKQYALEILEQEVSKEEKHNRHERVVNKKTIKFDEEEKSTKIEKFDFGFEYFMGILTGLLVGMILHFVFIKLR